MHSESIIDHSRAEQPLAKPARSCCSDKLMMAESEKQDTEDDNDILLHSSEPPSFHTPQSHSSRKSVEASNRSPVAGTPNGRKDNADKDSIRVTSEERSQDVSERNMYDNTIVSSMVSSSKQVKSPIHLSPDEKEMEMEKPSNDEPVTTAKKSPSNKGILRKGNRENIISKSSESSDDTSYSSANVSSKRKKKKISIDEAEDKEEQKRNEYMQWRRAGVPEFIEFEFGTDDCPTDDEKPKPPPPPPKKHRVQKAPRSHSPAAGSTPQGPLRPKQSPARIQQPQGNRPSTAAVSVADQSAAPSARSSHDVTAPSARSSHDGTREEPARYYKNYRIRQQPPTKRRSSSQERSLPTLATPAKSSSLPPTPGKEKKSIMAGSGKKLKQGQHKIAKRMKEGLKKAKSDMKSIVSRRSTGDLTDKQDKRQTQGPSLNERFRIRAKSSNNIFLPNQGTANRTSSIDDTGEINTIHNGKTTAIRRGKRSTTAVDDGGGGGGGGDVPPMMNSTPKGVRTPPRNLHKQPNAAATRSPSGLRPTRSPTRKSAATSQRQRRISPKEKRQSAPPAAVVPPTQPTRKKSLTPEEHGKSASVRKEAFPNMASPTSLHRQLRGQQSGSQRRRRSLKRDSSTPAVGTTTSTSNNESARGRPKLQQARSLGGLSTTVKNKRNSSRVREI
eukprot:scaffold504_cov109-Cylindrotheca_fusiformis.AAC.14